MTLLQHLLATRNWRAIPNCPGRYVLAEGVSAESPQCLVATAVTATRHVGANARDPVWVIAFDEGGLISYERGEGHWLHTLNDAEGLARKLADLGIA
jgi:hypothetical protein